MIFQGKEEFFVKRMGIGIVDSCASELEAGDLVNCVISQPVMQNYGNAKATFPMLMGLVRKLSRSQQTPFNCMLDLVPMLVWKKNQRIDKQPK